MTEDIAILSGFLSVGVVYDSQDNPAGEEIELYSDAPYLGTWINAFDTFIRYDGDKVEITIKRLP